MEGGIIAAGLGSRFRKAGILRPKPLIEVGGRPLISWTLQQFREAEIKKIHVIFRAAICRQCVDYLASAFPEMDFMFICMDTDSSSESFLTLLNTWDRDERVLITTVDSIYRPGMLRRFRNFAENRDEKALYLGITSYIEDEKPLYVVTGKDGSITSMGGKSGRFITTGAYLLHTSLSRGRNPKGYTALRILLKELAESPGVSVLGVDLGKVLDVDRPEDLASAEGFIAGERRFIRNS